MNKAFLISGAVTLWVVFAVIGAIDLIGGFGATDASSGALSRGRVSQVAAQEPERAAPVFTPLADPLTPARLIIPKLGIDATVEPVGLNIKGNMTVPSTYHTVSWYRPGSKAGASGNAVIAGHLDNSLGMPGIFERLHTLSVGDTIHVEDAKDRSLPYRVVSLSVYDVEDAPAANIFSTEGPSQLVLITCNGAWDHEKKSYDKRLVVVAKPVTF